MIANLVTDVVLAKRAIDHVRIGCESVGVVSRQPCASVEECLDEERRVVGRTRNREVEIGIRPTL